MRIEKAGYRIMLPFPDWETARDVLCQMIERAGRTCYKSESKITHDSARDFVKRIVRNKHEAMLEHAGLTIRFTVDRGVSHELVRHRLASFAQESTRYCNYGSGRFGKELTFISPCFFQEDSHEYAVWINAMSEAERSYLALIDSGVSPQEARTVLPNSLKTEVVMTANMREWRHFFRLRAVGETGKPHPQMLEVTVPLLTELKKNLPEIFSDIGGEGA